jgi:hypothetical protein
MLRRSLGICLALSALTATIAGAAGSPPPPSVEITRSPGGSLGPALSGAAVIWASPTTVYSSRGGRKHEIWQAPPVGIPADFQLDPNSPVKNVDRDIESMASSPAMTAFIASANLREGGVCSETEPHCHMPPALVTPIFFELLAGPPDGPFVRVEGGRRPCSQLQWLARTIDVAGSTVVVSETRRSCRQDAPRTPSRVALIDRGGGRMTRTVLAQSNDGYFDDVALTARYAAWELHLQAKTFVTVYDRLKRTVAYRALVDPYSSDIDMDLQNDGTVVGFSVQPVCGDSGAFIASLAQPRFRRLRVTGYGIKVRVARGALAFMRPSSCALEGIHAQLVLRRLGGSTTVVAGGDGQPVPLPEGFDFDGRRIAYFATVFGADGRRQFFALYVARVR